MQTEKATIKPHAPLGSFLGKLTPKTIEKPAENSVEVTPLVQEVKSEPRSEDKPGTKVDAPVKTDKQTVVTEAPKETTPDPDALKKQLSDQAKANLRLGQENADLRRTLESLQKQQERIEKKLDGTYEEEAAPSVEQIKADAELTGRIKASHKAAIDKYGEKFVMETVWNPDAPYQLLQAKDNKIRARVMEADDPVLEAIAVMKEQADGEKYGRTPEEIKKKIEAEMIPQLEQQIREGLKTKPGPATNTLGQVRGGSARTEQPAGTPNVLNLAQVFPWGASRR